MSCAFNSGAHVTVLLGQEDDASFAHRCGNCGRIGHSDTEDGEIEINEEEGGGPDLVRAQLSPRQSRRKG